MEKRGVERASGIWLVSDQEVRVFWFARLDVWLFLETGRIVERRGARIVSLGLKGKFIL